MQETVAGRSSGLIDEGFEEEFHMRDDPMRDDQASREQGPITLPAGLERRLYDFRGRVWRIKLLEAIAGAAFGVLVGYLAVFALDRLTETPVGVRLAAFLVAVAACAAIPVAFHRWIWGQRGLEQLARLISRRFPGIGDQLLGIIELVRSAESPTGLGDRSPRMLSRQALAGVIEPRVEEIFSLVHQVIRDSGYEELLSSGIVLTGGSAVMPGMVELGEDMFLKPVRRGNPTYAGALYDMVANPRSATVMGLLEEARLARARGQKAAAQAGSVKTVIGRAKEWFLGNF